MNILSLNDIKNSNLYNQKKNITFTYDKNNNNDCMSLNANYSIFNCIGCRALYDCFDNETVFKILNEFHKNFNILIF